MSFNLLSYIYMKTMQRDKLVVLVVLLTSIALSGCMVEQSITLNSELSGVWILEGAAMPFTASAFDDLAMLGGYDNATGLYDETLVKTKTDLAKRDDINSYRIELSGPSSWEAEIGFDNIESLLGSAEAGGIAEMSRRGDVNTLKLRFDRERAAKLEELVPLMQDPAFSLFNPAATGGIDEETYISGILGFTFGEENIPEIRRASIVMNVVLPGPVSSVYGGEKTGANSVRFVSSLTRFLVPDKEIYWSVSWSDAP
jgi:hypothetical protein